MGGVRGMTEFDINSLNISEVHTKEIDMEEYFYEYADIVAKKKSTNFTYDLAKRGFDIVGSLVGIIISLPILIIFTILIVLETPGSPIYRQKRLGENGKIFTLYKLRSMDNDAEKDGAKWASEDDSRVTKVGKFIRNTRIDETPQFLNILKGDMSLIGPRPERPCFTLEFNKRIPGFVDRLQVKPGLTGWAQVNGGYEINPEDKLGLDMHYIKNRNFSMDFKIIFKTFGVIFTGEGAR